MTVSGPGAWYWGRPGTSLDGWPDGWLPLGYTTEGAEWAFEVPDEPALSAAATEALRVGLSTHTIVSATLTFPQLSAWYFHRPLTGRRHPGERAARQRYVRRLRARRKRARR